MSNPQDIRVRFAPSPTGYLHVGGARTALFNWLFARKHGGKLILRIEDTDRERSTDEAIEAIIAGLDWLGIDFDEGPIYQSARIDRHQEMAAKLMADGHAYRDFSTADEMDAKRKAAKGAFKRDDAMRELTADESSRRADAGDSFVTRFRVPQDQEKIVFNDLVLGETKRHVNDIEDFALLRPDGSPMYHLGVTVDDADMAISHVIRGRDHRDNTFKHILLFEALGFDVPTFAHIPLILAPDKSKLSKRKHGDVVALTTYRDAGFLPEAFRNFLALLGWNPGDDREFMAGDELLEAFDLSGVAKSDAVYNFIEGHPTKWLDQKAFWMNSQYIRHRDIDQLEQDVTPWLKSAGLWQDDFAASRRDWFRDTLDVLRERYFTLKDFADKGRPFFSDDFEMEPKALKNLSKTDGLRGQLVELGAALSNLDDWSEESAEAAVREFAEAHDIQSGHIINGVRAAVTGQTVGPSLFKVLTMIGQDMVCARLARATEHTVIPRTT